jgi:hypothetical protein
MSKSYRQPQHESSNTAFARSASEEGRSDFHAMGDSATHIDYGNEAAGEQVVVNGVAFSAGEIAALVDYIGAPRNLELFNKAQLERMKELLALGDETLRSWNAATGGLYEQLSQANETHFRDGEAKGHGATFCEGFALALQRMNEALDAEDPETIAKLQNDAWLELYGAEHYLQDAFSAGHHASQDAIDAGALPVLDALGADGLALLAVQAGDRVFADRADTIAKFEEWTPLGWGAVGRASFDALALGGVAKEGQGAVLDALRKTVHERLCTRGVTVTSEAHPAPFLLPGDHRAKREDGTTEGAEAEAAVVAALAFGRELLPHGAPDPAAAAASFWKRWAPTPTPSSEADIQAIVTECTQDRESLLAAFAFGVGETLDDVLDAAAARAPALLRRKEEADEMREIVADPTEHTNPAQGDAWNRAHERTDLVDLARRGVAAGPSA